jgi:hypothetical protein
VPAVAQDAVAEDVVARPAAVLGLMRPSEGADGALQEVLTSSIAVKLARWGLQAITEPITAFESQTASESETLFALAQRFEADYVLEGVYSNSRDEIEIQLVWYNASTQQVAASVSERGRLGLNMDRLLSEAMAEIFAEVGKELPRFEGAVGEPVLLRTPPVTAGGSSGFSAPSPLPPGRTDPDVRPDVRPGEPLEPDTPEISLGKPRRKHVELSTAGSAFIATGEVSEYFKIGYGSALYLDLLIPTGAGSLALGLYAGVNYFQAAGVATSAQSFLIPLGADIRYTLDKDLPFGLFVHLGGGPAMLILRSDFWGDLSELVPYAMAGLGATLPFAPFMGTALDLSYSVYFEGSLLIMAFSPSVSLYFRF